jgi:phosphomannomutase
MAKKSTKTTSRPAARKTRGKIPAAKPSGPPASDLIVSISGIRGIAGQALTASTIVPYVDAFARLVKGRRVVVGHDARPSSKWIVPLVEGVLRSLGIDVLFVGLAATPTIGLLVRKLKLAGGIAITASHNPIQWNGLKFFHSGGEFLTAEMLAELKQLVADPNRDRLAHAIGKRAHYTDGPELHLQALLHNFPPPERVRASRRPTVLIDCCNSAGAELAPDVADAYGALFQLINSDTTKFEFPRGPEPTEANIVTLCRAVVRENADLGFAIDPDADRLAIVDEKGVPIGEERTLLLAADAFLTMQKKKSPLVVNLSTTMALDDLARSHGVPIYRTAIGEANVLAGMREHRSQIGGEGNGGVIVPKIHPGRDAATAIALVLSGLQSRGGTLSEWNASFPNYAMRKEAIPLTSHTPAEAISKFKRAFAREKIDTTDGVKVIMADRWIHLRPSNTEPIMRIYAEAPTEDAVAELIERVSGLLSE